MTTQTICTYDTLTTLIRDRFHGRLIVGCGDGTETACINQAVALCEGVPVTDNPVAIGRPDFRPLNDGPWSSPELRAVHMTRLASALAPWATWTAAERRTYMTRVIIATVRVIIAGLPRLPEAVAQQCRAVSTLAEAMKAAEATGAGAASEAAKEAARMVRGAAAAAAASSGPAGGAAAAAAARSAALGAAESPDLMLIQTVDQWIAALPSGGDHGC